jgi:hypothetical protein
MHQKCTSNPIINPLPTSKAFGGECEMTGTFFSKIKHGKQNTASFDGEYFSRGN